MTTDLIYVAWNRLAFTRKTFRLMLQNTDWDIVRRVTIYDDGSSDGTREYLEAAMSEIPVHAKLVHLGHGSPVFAMNHYVGDGPADAFVKVDNDICLPPGWLPALTGVAERHPEILLLGMEAGQTWLHSRDGEPYEGVYSVQACSHIGGIGLIRTKAFERSMPWPRGRFGFTEWQRAMQPNRAWIAPDLFVPQLDRMPTEPWRTLSKRYHKKGWQRRWPLMDPYWAAPYFDWIGGPE